LVQAAGDPARAFVAVSTHRSERKSTSGRRAPAGARTNPINVTKTDYAVRSDRLSTVGAMRTVTDDPMPYVGGRWLLLRTLMKGLADAVRRDDASAAERYRRRLRLANAQLAADDSVHDVLEKLLYIIDHWVVAAAVDRDETKGQMLEMIERIVGLLTS